MLEHDLFLAVTVVAELRGGARKSARPEFQNGLIDRFLTTATVLPNDLSTASIYGDTWASLATSGDMIPTNDIWIAASAIQYDLALITDDAHFSKVSGLTVGGW